MTSHTAFLVIDMQNSFSHPQGVLADLVGPIDGRGALIPALATAVAAARRDGLPVIYLRQVFQPSYTDADAVFRRLLPQAMDRGALIRGSWDAEIIDELAPHNGDTVIDKTRFDGFHNTPLDTVLRSLSIDHLLVTGAYTNICVETTVRSAFIRDYTVTVLADCVGARDPIAHTRALDALRDGHFAAITTSDTRNQ